MLRTLAVLILVAGWLGAIAPPCRAQERADRALILETLAVEGNARTSRDVALRSFPLREGDAVDPDRLLDAVDALRAVDLFAKVDFRTEPGTARGLVRVVLVVEEKGVELRFGTGYQDLDGWYLVPAELRFDNRLGRGEELRLTSKIGYRVGGVDLSFGEPRAGGEGQLFWGVDVAAFGLQRVYFVDGVEIAHRLGRGAIGAHVGRRLGASWRVEAGARAETIDADSTAEVNEDDDVRSVSRGDEVAFADLPAGVADDVGERRGEVLHLEIARDTRAARLVAGTPERGFWGRVRFESFLRESAEASALTADLRLYRRAANVSLAMRVRGGVIGEGAAFYDRFHLGGLYTVRGFPSQSLSPAEGDTRFWIATLEVRGALVGPTPHPRLAGLLFADAGQGWGERPHEDFADASASAGFGVRLRVPWLAWVGVDFGVPLTDSPVRENFHGNAALGWNF
jgi:outer membrane protein assembly factor BamA